jgi:hypothetical protein
MMSSVWKQGRYDFIGVEEAMKVRRGLCHSNEAVTSLVLNQGQYEIIKSG